MRREPGIVEELGYSWLRVHRRPNPFVALWRWRWELGGIGILAALYIGLVHVGGLTAIIVLIGLAILMAIVWPWFRRRIWVLTTTHRIRVGMRHAGLSDVNGRLPAVLWSAPTDRGERVVLWRRPAPRLQDVERARPLLAAATWAIDVEVSPHPRYSHIVELEVIRRPFEEAIGKSAETSTDASRRNGRLRKLRSRLKSHFFPADAKAILIADPITLADEFASRIDHAMAEAYTRLGPPPGLEGHGSD